jgi:hypothetical protein
LPPHGNRSPTIASGPLKAWGELQIGKNRTEEPQALVIRRSGAAYKRDHVYDIGRTGLTIITNFGEGVPGEMAQPICTERKQQINRGRMLPFNGGKYDVYGPDTLEVMGAASTLRWSCFPLIFRVMNEPGESWRCSSFDTWIVESPQENSVIWRCSIS